MTLGLCQGHSAIANFFSKLTNASRGPSAIAKLLIISPTIASLCDVTQGNPDDEFQ